MIMRIQEMREARGMKQVDFAASVGVSQGTTSGWENELYLPQARLLPLIAHVLGCSIDELFTPWDDAG